MLLCEVSDSASPCVSCYVAKLLRRVASGFAEQGGCLRYEARAGTLSAAKLDYERDQERDQDYSNPA